MTQSIRSSASVNVRLTVRIRVKPKQKKKIDEELYRDGADGSVIQDIRTQEEKLPPVHCTRFFAAPHCSLTTNDGSRFSLVPQPEDGAYREELRAICGRGFSTM